MHQSVAQVLITHEEIYLYIYTSGLTTFSDYLPTELSKPSKTL